MYNLITTASDFTCPVSGKLISKGNICLVDKEGTRLSCSQLPERKLIRLSDLLKTGYIELVSESGWKKPIQAYSKIELNGKLVVHHFFSEWDTFEEAIQWLTHAHMKPIVINRKSKIGI